ncbi:sensor domain-containing phosphodiesterase [Variovorax sp. J22G73]|uniref:bifunctional diguanylate cyclase/phosphodiesterase n=1 Tax=unclassified Variovorax TaxID=663243 RepID=UPI0025750BE1|nr:MULTISPECIES: sensor domain-containing phosphodiesterase [unclassified Variovorax]MDM0010566.1 sensor domain-containing phosphodiesterase [Variovorax sp. J22R203]MDM0103105.1 sensor domain-containing phosphodiesterase [Variovorax sp. J22G73]
MHPDDADVEARRVHALHSTGLLDTRASESFDRVTRLAVALFDVPIALVSLVDTDRQWFKSRLGLDAVETTRDVAFCDYTIRAAEVLVVEDAALDPRFAGNPLVTGEPLIRFYAGAPLILQSGEALGSLCIIDRLPRTFTIAQRGQLQDLAAMVVAQIDLHRAAGRVDDVTQLPNHARMLEDLTDLAKLFPGQDRTMLLVEAMDHGAVRDAARAIGIARVEDFLKNLALTLQRLLREGSELYFVGVGRFAVLTALKGPELGRLVDLLDQALTQPVASGNLFVELEAAIGVVQFTLMPEEAQEALRKAMTAVHQARAAGRSRMVYEQEFDVRHQRAFAILRDLPNAIANDELYLVFQPKLRVSSGVFEGVEALLRWNHPQLGNIPPGVFIPLAENTTLIHDITNWVIDAALRELVALSSRDLSIAVAVAVNVSARNLERPDFIADLERILARHPVMPDRLHIECTEYSRLTDPAIMEVLLKIRALGIQLSLDDFGIGYSNLTCLEKLPFQLIKIDQSLVIPIAGNPRARRLLEGVVALGHGMGFRLLAEGVETQEVFRQVIDLGFDHVQGYYLSRPLSPEALIRFLENPPSIDNVVQPTSGGSGAQTD